MQHGYFVVEGGECGGECGSGIALHDDGIGALGGEEVAGLGEDAGGEVGQLLVGLHHIECEVYGYVEEVDDLLQHLFVLACGADEGGELRAGEQCINNWCQLDGLWPGAEKYDDLLGHGVVVLVVPDNGYG